MLRQFIFVLYNKDTRIFIVFDNHQYVLQLKF